MISSTPMTVKIASSNNVRTDSETAISRNPRIKLQQWRMLEAVVTCGSFANAAEHLHVSQPAISYSIARLEEILGVRLLRMEGRKAQITEAGRILLEKSRHLLLEAVELEDMAESLRHGLCAEVRFAVSSDFPMHALGPALRLFADQHKTPKVRLTAMPVMDIDHALCQHRLDLAISRRIPDGLEGRLIADIEYVAVAHPNHPLFKLGRKISLSDLGQETQVTTIAGLDYPCENTRRGMPLCRKWAVDSFDTAMGVVREGLGYGWLPRYRINEALRTSDIKVLPLADGMTPRTSFFLVHPTTPRPTIGVSQLLHILHSSLPQIARSVQ